MDSAIVTGEDLTDEEIVELARTDTTDGDDADNDVEVPRPPSSIEAKATINLMFRYLEAHSSSTDSGLKAARRLQFEIDRVSVATAKQTSITDFFKSSSSASAYVDKFSIAFYVRSSWWSCPVSQYGQFYYIFGRPFHFTSTII